MNARDRSGAGRRFAVGRTQASKFEKQGDFRQDGLQIGNCCRPIVDLQHDRCCDPATPQDFELSAVTQQIGLCPLQITKKLSELFVIGEGAVVAGPVI